MCSTELVWWCFIEGFVGEDGYEVTWKSVVGLKLCVAPLLVSNQVRTTRECVRPSSEHSLTLLDVYGRFEVIGRLGWLVRRFVTRWVKFPKGEFHGLLWSYLR